MTMPDSRRTARRPRARRNGQCFAESLECRTLLSVALVTDINTNTVDSDPIFFTESGGLLFFSADDGQHGVELWKTDGTAAGTSLVKDIDPRPVHKLHRWGPGELDLLGVDEGNSYPTGLADVNDTLFFYADDAIHGGELWKSDGTAAGTVMVKDINPGPANSNYVDGYGSTVDLASIAELNGAAYFLANDGASGWALWRSDGTEAGTVPVRPFPGMRLDQLTDFHVLNGRLYFDAFEPATGWEPWVSDGTAAGTMLLTDVFPGPTSSERREFVAAGGSVFFNGMSGRSSQGGLGGFPVYGLWQTDGTPAGTRQVAGGYSHVTLGSTGPRLFVGTVPPVPLDDGTLWKMDAGDTGLVHVEDFPGRGYLTSNNSPRSLTRIDDATIFFRVSDPAHGDEPWRSDGTEAGTIMLADLVAGTGSSAVGQMVNVSGIVYFTGASNRVDQGPGPGNGELFKTDGTPAGTVLVKDILPGILSSAPKGLTAYQGRVWFSAVSGYAGGAVGRELWVSDGTEAGTTLFKDINTDTGDGASIPLPVTSGGKTFFVGQAPETGPEVWVTDGTDAGTRMLKDIPREASYLPPFFLGLVDGTLFFLVSKDLWKSDGTPEGTVLVREAVETRDVQGGSGWAFNLGGTLLFAGSDAEHGFEIWRSDGTAAGTSLLKDVNPGLGDSTPQFHSRVGNSVLFWADDGVHGRELWKTDGTPEGTVMVKDIRPGPQPANGYAITGVIMNGVAYFAADDGTSGGELWRSDGTEAGTRRVADLMPGTPSAGPRDFVVLNDTLYFLGRVGTTFRDGDALYRSDGTEAGTTRVPLDFGGPVSLSYLAAMRDSLYFTASATGRYGLSRGEVYRSDGTPVGTVRLRENVTGLGWTALGDKVYFVDFAGEDFTIPPFSPPGAGAELWETDGTPAGTKLVADINPGPANSMAGSRISAAPYSGSAEWWPGPLVNDGSKLLFVADDGRHGRELWRLTPDGPPPPPAVVGRHVFYNNSAFDGRDPAANAADDAAIAADKVARRPGHPGNFLHITSYDKGINGVMVDIAGLPAGAAQTLSAADFETVGGDTLVVIPPRSVTVRRGAGVNGSDRVTLTWSDYNPATMRANVDVVVNGWLRVTVKANVRTGLAQPEVFSFGNLAGETGDAPNGPGVTAIDIAAVRRGMRSGAATVLNPLDVNRDGRVNALDLALVRRNLGRTLLIQDVP